jgi:uncharacterized protein (DUF362 family)
MDRRRFLTAGATMLGTGLLSMRGAAALAGDAAPEATSSTGAPPTSAVTDLPDLVLARGPAHEATRRALEAVGGMQRFVKPGQVVVIKPNASFSCPPDWGATTHPDVITAVLEACFDADARRVLVVDHTMPNQRKCFEKNGTAAAVAGFPKAKLVSLDNEKSYRAIEVPDGKALHTTQVPAVMQKADVFINLPTAKSHAATVASLGFKNLMGLVWDRQSFHRDFDLHQGVADLGTVLKPQLTVLDAVRILQTGGPTGPGKTETFDGVVVGADPVAVDAYGVGLSSWNGRTCSADQIPHILLAAEHGLGTLDLDSLRIEELG